MTDPAGTSSMDVLAGFHPAVRVWFQRRFPHGPTEPQQRGWPLIRAGGDTLIAAPTGSGKTLSGFLVAIDALYRAHERGDDSAHTTRVVYVSPLKALAVDIHENLRTPLEEIRRTAGELGLVAPELTVAVRTGDTPSAARAAMAKQPPTFLVTTPESLYLLVTAERSRNNLRGVRTVIVDEIHATARDKRGAHLALTLERLEHVAEQRPQRIGLSATQKPVETIARLLSGAGPARSVSVADCGHQRHLDLAIELPGSELTAAASLEQLGEVLDRIAQLVGEHRTTLVFVNTRRMAERIAHQLGERLDDAAGQRVAAHHGSLSKDRRLRVETQLRAGELRALVATASLELGIDIGPVELVCQIGSPRSIATFLQRVGRSNHSRGGTPAGRLFPLTRDELVECTALLAAVRGGRLDAISPPRAPLDVLVQQVVAEVATGEWEEAALYDLVRRAAPYEQLDRADFDAVVELASEGIQTGRGRRAAYLHRDRVHGVLRPRRGARLAALTSGGAIPEVGDYRVVADPDDTFVGTVNEDWAIESMAGDVFLLGSTSWRIRRVEPGTVRVTDARGAHPTVPFWLGEAPARTDELSREVSALRAAVERCLALEDPAGARASVERAAGVDAEVAREVVSYLAAGRSSLGVLPTHDDVVIERFFDDTGGMQLVVHAPFGGRVTRALGLALRKRFCTTFDFELQAAADDNAVVLSLGPQHSFPLQDVARFLRSHDVEDVLTQAVLPSPMFTSRWRWNLNRALAVLRFRAGRRNPLPLQRMEADDLMAAVFPALAGCQDNAVAGPLTVPDHVLVRQTLHDALYEAMDVDGLRRLVRGFETGSVRVHFVEAAEPSVLSHEILNGRPYTFLDDAPLEERRTRAVSLRRGLPVETGSLGAVDPAALERVRAEAVPSLRDAEELHDLLLSLVVCSPRPEWAQWFATLSAAGRAWVTPEGRWAAEERRALVDGLAAGDDVAAASCVRGHLEVTGPVTEAELVALTGLADSRVRVGLARLEGEGFAIRVGTEQWCARRLLARAHAYTRQRLRREIESVSAQDFLRFLLRWHHVVPGTRREGRRGVLAVIDQLQGFELAAGAWEESVLPARVEGYQRPWLDDLCLSGELVWGRLSVADENGRARRGAATPSRATPLTFAVREDLPWLLQVVRGPSHPAEPVTGPARDVLDALRQRGALFHAELRALTGRLPVEVEEGLWDLVARGLVTADGFQAVRSLLSARERWRRRQRPDDRRRALGRRRAGAWRETGEGRWALLPEAEPADDVDALAETAAEQLLARWGVVFWDLVARETLAVPWREIVWAFRRMEARGLIRGGRFVTGFVGEQYALPEAVDELRAVRHLDRRGEVVTLSGADPLNLVGILTPGERIPATRTNLVSYRDGLPVEPVHAATPGR